MNALTIGSLAAMAFMGILAALWFYRRGKAEGASEQKDEDREGASEYMEENAKNWYDGRIGTDALPVREPGKWGKGSPANAGARMEPGNGDVSKRGKDGGEVHDA